MLNKKINDCMELTEAIMCNHYQRNHDLLVAHLHKDCLWIGSIEEEYYKGRDVILKVLHDVMMDEKRKLPLIYLRMKEFECVMHDRNSCIISGRYIGVTEEDSGEIFCDRQRVTFGWKEEKGKLYVQHIHVSNPMTCVKDDEVFPHEIGKYTRQYLDMLIRKDIERSGYIEVRDKEYMTHRVQINDVIYMEAVNVDTIVHTVDGDIFARSQMSDLEKQMQIIQEGLFVRVHKSFCVNKYHVKSICRYELTMSSREKIPVSKDHFKEIKEHLQI